MKFKIKKEVVAVEEKTIDITLKKHGKDVCLMVEDYYVLAIKPDGTIVVYAACEETGLNVDDVGYVIIERK